MSTSFDRMFKKKPQQQHKQKQQQQQENPEEISKQTFLEDNFTIQEQKQPQNSAFPNNNNSNNNNRDSGNRQRLSTATDNIDKNSEKYPQKPRTKQRTYTENIILPNQQADRYSQQNNELNIDKITILEQPQMEKPQTNIKIKFSKEELEEYLDLKEFKQQFNNLQFKGNSDNQIKAPMFSQNRYVTKFKSPNFSQGQGIVYYPEYCTESLSTMFQALYCKTPVIHKYKKHLHSMLKKLKEKKQLQKDIQQQKDSVKHIVGFNKEKYGQAMLQLQQLLKNADSENEKKRIEITIQNLEQMKNNIISTEDETQRKKNIEFLNKQLEKICQTTFNETVDEQLLNDTIQLLQDRIKLYEDQILNFMGCTSNINKEEDPKNRQKLILNFNGLLRQVFDEITTQNKTSIMQQKPK